MIPISVCIITKNEAEHLEKCLAALKPYPFEIIVTDTGSTDDSIEVARKYTDKVYNFEWINDFSAARNFTINKASHNVILSLDTDEFIKDIDLGKLEQLIQDNPKCVGSVEMLNYFEDNGNIRYQAARLDRLFNRRYYHFENPIHEVLSPIAKIPYLSYDAPIVVDHVGYLGSKEYLSKKSLRDMELLKKELETDPDNPYLYFQIAQCYMMMRDTEHAAEYFKISISHNPTPDDDYTRILVTNYGSILLDNMKVEEAMQLLSYYDYFNDNADYLCMIGRAYLLANQPLKALPEFVKSLTAPKRDSVEPRLASYNIGFIYELFGKKDIAAEHYRRCGDYAPALEALERICN
ncbi:MAG: glycosyltransferase [Lachnospiraceae bacterium]|nr:glycosyltransferase [Lachnospiraceae bacterium]